MTENPGGSKGRVLFLQRFLEEHTDDEHCITTEELISLYQENGYKAVRQTIVDDVAVLMASGFDVVVDQVARNKTKTNAYCIGARLFELAELKLLVDAVSSSRFITAEKSELLIRKLQKLTNEENRQDLTARIYTGERLKTSNNLVLISIDAIYHAIRFGRKIAFHYWDYTPDRRKVLKHDGAEYIASPYVLVWNDERYYAICHSDKHNQIVNFRVDRMCDIRELKERAFIDPGFSVAEYSRKVIHMYDANLPERYVTLRCLNEHMRNVMDQFGEDVRTKQYDDNSFRAMTNVVPSSTFFGWVMQFRGGILIEKPADVKQAYEEMLSAVLERQKSFGDGTETELTDDAEANDFGETPEVNPDGEGERNAEGDEPAGDGTSAEAEGMDTSGTGEATGKEASTDAEESSVPARKKRGRKAAMAMENNETGDSVSAGKKRGRKAAQAVESGETGDTVPAGKKRGRKAAQVLENGETGDSAPAGKKRGRKAAQAMENGETGDTVPAGKKRGRKAAGTAGKT